MNGYVEWWVQVPIWDEFLMGKARVVATPSSNTATIVEDCLEVDDECQEVSVLINMYVGIHCLGGGTCAPFDLIGFDIMV